MAAGLAALLAVAVALKPSPLGLGTHQQLGLPPCSFQVLFGWPCPSCGMTTSWAHLVRGQLFGALRANVGGTLLGLIAVAATPWLAVSAARGRWWGWTPHVGVAAWLAAGVVFVTLIDWGFRLASIWPS